MDGSFDARMEKLGDVIARGQHTIPRYQRRYAWEENNIRDFWNDIVKEKKKSHFLGSMVVANADDLLEVIDGQQRLTTTLILLTVLRDRFDAHGLSQLTEGIQQYLTYKDLNGNDQVRLENVDQSARNRLIDEVLIRPEEREETSGEVSKERRAYEVFSELLDGVLSETDDVESVLVFIRDALLQANVVYVKVADRPSAFTIFETLNDRGRDLTVMDLVKNLLLSKLPASADEKTERDWSEMLENLELAEIEGVTPPDFLYYYWNSKAPKGESTHEEITNTRIRRSIQDFIEGGHGEDEAIERGKELVGDLKITARIFLALSETLQSRGSAEPWKRLDQTWREDKWIKICRELHGILVTGANQPLPLLFSLMRRYIDPKRQMKNADLAEFLRVIKIFQFRWSIAQKPSTSTQRRMYRRAAAGVETAQTTEDLRQVIKTFSAAANQQMATDNQFRSGLEKLVYSRTRRKDIGKVKYILTEVERDTGCTRVDFKDPVSIEHLEGQGKKSEITPRNSWVFKLGNLTLLHPDVNSKLPKEFKDKTDRLAEWVNPADEALVDAIQSGIWGAPKANERMIWIQDQAMNIWPGSV